MSAPPAADGPVLVAGATGFIGGHVVAALGSGRSVRALVRSPDDYSPPAGVEVVEGDLRDRASLDRACAGCSAVISAAAVTGEKKPPRGGYDAINVDGIANLARAAAGAGVGRIVHFGGIDRAGTDAGPYLRGRRAGEEALKRAGTPWTILQPSVLFGPRAPFIAALAGLVRAPITPVAGDGTVRLQPIHVDDVARCAVEALDGSGRTGRYIELGGPDVLTFDEVLDVLGEALSRGRVRKLHLPVGLVSLNARLLRFLPNPPVRPAAVELLSFDNVAESESVVEQEFGFAPRHLRQHVSEHGLEL
jgi:uncharacterized protein YbjT (DUF2867 family)